MKRFYVRSGGLTVWFWTFRGAQKAAIRLNQADIQFQLGRK